MSGCLGDPVLLSIAVGEGSAEERAHLASCPACTARYRALESDLDVIGRALRQGPPPRPAAAPVRSIERAWLAPLAVAAVVLLAVALRFSHRSPNVELASAPPAATSSSSETSSYAEEVSAAMFDGPSERRLSNGLFDFAADSVVQRGTPEASALQAALEAGDACTSGRLWNGDCNDYASALFF